MPCRLSRSCASAIVARTSATPDMTADMVANSAPISAASRRARLVLPVPGGPHRMSDDEVAAGHAPAERSALADEVFLPDELREGARAHPGRQRLAPGGGWKSGSGRAPTGRRADGMNGW